MKRVAVTGGSGKAGRGAIEDLLQHGYTVVNLDAAPPAKALCPFVQLDLADFGQAYEGLSGVDDRHAGLDAVVHLAAIPAPGKAPNSVIFRNNIVSTYNLRGSAPAPDQEHRLGVERNRARPALR